MVATRAATPCSTIRRRSEAGWLFNASVIRPYLSAFRLHLPRELRPIAGRRAVTKKSGPRGNPLSKTDRITSDRYEMSISGRPEYSDLLHWRKGESGP